MSTEPIHESTAESEKADSDLRSLERSNRARPLERVASVLEILFVALFGPLVASLVFWAIDQTNVLASSGIVFAFASCEALVTLGVIFVLVRLDGRRFRDLGFGPDRPFREVAIGIAVIPLLFATTSLVILVFTMLLPEYLTVENPLLALIQDWGDVGLFILTSLLVGGFKEEVQRAFVLERFRRNLGGVVAGLVIWSFFFGAMHMTQGIDLAVAAGFLGLIFGLLYVFRGNIWAPIAAHGIYDVVVVLIAWMLVEC